MTALTFDQEALDRAVALHRSLCPGLAVGIKAAQIAVAELGQGPDDPVALVESDICAVDGVQAVTGCTLGNRNILLQDWGKNAYTFWRKSDGKAIRVHGDVAWEPGYQALRKKIADGTATEAEVASFDSITEEEAHRILETDAWELFDVTAVTDPVPQTSRVDPFVACAHCHEQVMESRTRQLYGETVCIPCYEAARAVA
jgi:formylmethanofuran dehydrogenase subunit E